ncbi:MAG: sigma-70 family RNA polymerase sigma factor [Bacteroidota bacterium]
MRNDVVAQEQLYRRFAPLMYGICLRYVRNRAEADDIMQEAFIKVFDNLENFRDDGSFEGWIKRIIVNTALNHYKSSLKFDYKDERFMPDESVENEAVGQISTRELMAVINNLQDNYRLVFNLSVIEGFGHAEIAQLLGMSEASSRITLLRARKIIKEKMKTHYNIHSYEQAI